MQTAAMFLLLKRESDIVIAKHSNICWEMHLRHVRLKKLYKKLTQVSSKPNLCSYLVLPCNYPL